MAPGLVNLAAQMIPSGTRILSVILHSSTLTSVLIVPTWLRLMQTRPHPE